MARRRRRTEVSVSLFPFLSVLSCVIGALTLMIAASAVGRVAEDLADEPTQEVPSDVVLYDEADLEALQSQVDDAVMLEAELEGLRSQLRAAGFDVDGDPQIDRTIEARAQWLRLRDERSRLEREREQMAAAIGELDEAAAAKMRASENAPIAIQPRGEGTGLLPIFVECSEEGVTLHRPGAGALGPLRIRDLAEKSRFQAYLRRYSSNKSATVVLLIRPDGVPMYELAVDLVSAARIRPAKLPLPGDGPLDFSLF